MAIEDTYDIYSEESIWGELEPGSEDITKYSHKGQVKDWYNEYGITNYDYGSSGLDHTQVGARYDKIAGLEHGDASLADFQEDVQSLYLSDLLYDLSGGDLGYLDIIAGSTRANLREHDQYGRYLYDIEFLQDQAGVTETSKFNIAYGEEDSLYNDYLDKYFEFDEYTGRYKTKYDVPEFEELERNVYYEEKDALSEQIEKYALSKINDATRSVSASVLTLDDLMRFGNSRLDKLSRNLEVAKGESRATYYDEMKAQAYEMISNMDLSAVGSYEDRYNLDKDAPTAQELYNLGLREYGEIYEPYDEDYIEWAEGV